MNSTPIRWLVLGFCVTLGAFSALLCYRRLAHAGNPWAGTLDVQRPVHSVTPPKDGHWHPDVGYVTDVDHSVVCYFFRNHHWWEGQPILSCVHVGNDFLIED